MSYDDWKLAIPDDEDFAPRLPGCECDQEEGDSPCPVHGMNEDDLPEEEREDLNDSDDFEVSP